MRPSNTSGELNSRGPEGIEMMDIGLMVLILAALSSFLGLQVYPLRRRHLVFRLCVFSLLFSGILTLVVGVLYELGVF